MITIKFFGVLKKSFHTDILKLNHNNFSNIINIISYLAEIKPKNTPSLDLDNIIIAINGIDIDALDGKSTKLHKHDTISMIPIIHGGSVNRINFTIYEYVIEIMEINHMSVLDILKLRKYYTHTIIQAVSKNYILNKSHIKKIITISLSAMKRGILLSNTLEIDILLRFACTTQISKALELVGIKKNQNFILIIITNKKSILDELYKNLKNFIETNMEFQNNSKFLLNQFHITNKQLHSVFSDTPLEDLLVEKSALLF